MKESLIRRGLTLEYITLGWNVIGCVVVFVSAYMASSIALMGFGADSLIEIFASVIVVWQLKSINKDKEKLAEKLIGVGFLLLAFYILAQTAVVLYLGFHPGTSLLGISWLLLTTIIMFLLAYGKKKTGNALQNPVLQKEAKVTVIDALLAMGILTGIVLNYTLGFWWADPVAALTIAYYGAKEGWHVLS